MGLLRQILGLGEGGLAVVLGAGAALAGVLAEALAGGPAEALVEALAEGSELAASGASVDALTAAA